MINITEKGCGINCLVDKRISFDFHTQDTCELKVIGSSRMFDLPENMVVYDNELVQYSSGFVGLNLEILCGRHIQDKG